MFALAVPAAARAGTAGATGTRPAASQRAPQPSRDESNAMAQLLKLYAGAVEGYSDDRTAMIEELVEHNKQADALAGYLGQLWEDTAGLYDERSTGPATTTMRQPASGADARARLLALRQRRDTAAADLAARIAKLKIELLRDQKHLRELAAARPAGGSAPPSDRTGEDPAVARWRRQVSAAQTRTKALQGLIAHGEGLLAAAEQQRRSGR